MKRALSLREVRAFTITEVMVASAVSLMIFGAVLTAVVTFQRSFTGAIDYSRGTIDQQRVLDYISRDLRRALTVTVSTDTNTLTITVPDAYGTYDAQGNPSGPVKDPDLSTGKVNYGDPAKPVTICYYVQNNQMLRQQTIGATNAVSTLVIADSVELLQSSFKDLNCIVNYSVTFAPKLTRSDRGSQQARASTVLSGTTSVRNARRD